MPTDKVQPIFGRLLTILNNSRVQQSNPALYDYLKGLLESNVQSQGTFKVDLKGLEDLIKSLGTDVGDIKEASVITDLDETDTFANSRILLPGTNITFDKAINGELRINSSGTGGAGSIILETREVPLGIIDGINVTFTLANTPIAGTEQVFLNGLLQDTRGIDYSISGAVITFLIPPVSTDRILVTYQR